MRVGLLVVAGRPASRGGSTTPPDYRRIATWLERLPEDVAVLGTTATANEAWSPT